MLLGAAGVVVAWWCCSRSALPYVTTHVGRAVVPPNDLGAAYENVSFRTSDGLRLVGWYIPSKNGAAVIAFPGRKGPQEQARMLARHGYGVLLFDRRGEGESEGEPNSWGWGGTKDVKAAVAFLQRRPDVERGRIGGIGLSVGGEMMLDAASNTPALAAVVSEGAGARMFTEEMDQDLPPVEKATNAPSAWIKQASIAVFSDQSPPTNLKDLVPKIAPRAMFLIAAPNAPTGEDLNRGYYKAAGEPKTLWEIPESKHVGGMEARSARVRAARDRVLRPGAAAVTRHRGGEALVFGVASALILVHAIDDAFVHRGPGLGLGQHALAAAISIAAVVAGVLVFPSLRPGLRAALALAFGGLACVNGMLHVIHVANYGAEGSDVTGVVAVAAGAVLVGLAAFIPWRHRGERATSTPRRWLRRAIVAVAGFLAVLFVLGPMSLGIIETHRWREPIGPRPSAAYKTVTFRASDGLMLAGWYRPSATAPRSCSSTVAAAIDGAVAHAEMLARHGYGVLVYDARGRGESEGSPNGYGWDWGKDVAGALAFLGGRDDVEPDRIGALGLSTGADVLIEVAAKRRDLAAVVADGAAAGSFEDWHRLLGQRARPAAGLGHVHHHARALRRPSRPTARGPRQAHPLSGAAHLGGRGRGARLQRPLRRRRQPRGRALEPPRRPPHERHPRTSAAIRAARRHVLRQGAQMRRTVLGIAVTCVLAAAAPAGAVVGGQPGRAPDRAVVRNDTTGRRRPGRAGSGRHRRALRGSPLDEGPRVCRRGRRSTRACGQRSTPAGGTRTGRSTTCDRQMDAPWRASPHDAGRGERAGGDDPRARSLDGPGLGHGRSRLRPRVARCDLEGHERLVLRELVRSTTRATAVSLRRRAHGLRHRRRRRCPAELGLQRRQRRPVLHWHGRGADGARPRELGGSRCGADHLPSVFADATRYRSFILDPTPIWEPLTAEPARVTGTRKVGAKLTCRTTGSQGARRRSPTCGSARADASPVTVSRARTYTVRKADAGHPLVCAVEASNDGGIAMVPFATSAIAHIPR